MACDQCGGTGKVVLLTSISVCDCSRPGRYLVSPTCLGSLEEFAGRLDVRLKRCEYNYERDAWWIEGPRYGTVTGWLLGPGGTWGRLSFRRAEHGEGLGEIIIHSSIVKPQDTEDTRTPVSRGES